MEVKIQDVESCVRTLAIKVTKDEVEKEYASLFDEFKNNIVIPGFRKGKFPRKLFERKYADTIKDDVKSRIKDNYLAQALEQEKLEPLIKPQVDDQEFKRGESFEFNVTVEIKPAFDLPDLSGISLVKEVREISDDMIDREIEFLRERKKEYKGKEGDTVEEGDKVSSSYEIIVDDEVIETQADGSMYAETGGAFLGDVEKYPDCIIGKKKGSAVTLNTTLPPYFHKKEYQGKKAAVKLEIKKIERKVLPGIDDKEFLDFYQCDSVDDMRTKISASILADFEREQKSKLYQQIYEHFDASMNFDLPPTLLKGEIDSRKRNMRAQLQQAEKKDPEEIEKKVSEAEEDIIKDARRVLRNFFLLEGIADANTIVVTEEELNQRISGLALQQRVTPADMKEHLRRTGGIDNIRGSIREEKTLEFIAGKAGITEEKAAEEKPAKKESGASARKKAVTKKTDEAADDPKEEKKPARKTAQIEG